METYRVTYFNKRGGGEIIRLLFVAAGKEFEDERLDPDQWKNRKPDMPMKNLPVLQVKNGKPGVTFCQSGAIARHLARKFCFYGNTFEDAMVVDEVYDCVSDVRAVLVKIHFSKSETQKIELQTALQKEVLPNFCNYLEQRMLQFGRSGFIVGETLTLADIAVFNMVDTTLEMGLTSLWQPYPALGQHRQHVLVTNSRIAQWVKTRPKTAV